MANKKKSNGTFDTVAPLTLLCMGLVLSIQAAVSSAQHAPDADARYISDRVGTRLFILA